MEPPSLSEEAVTILGPRQASRQYVVEAAMELAGVKAGDVCFDLGCNDGRYCIEAARRGAKATGVEILPDAVERARERVMEAGVADLVQIVEGDALKIDVTSASVLFLYLLPKGMKELGDKLRQELRPGARIVTYIFSLPDFDLTAEKVLPVGDSSKLHDFNKIRLYVIPSK